MEQQELLEQKTPAMDYFKHADERRAELFSALIQARKKFKPLTKSGKNPRFGNKYATIDDLIESTYGALAEHGLFVTHDLRRDGPSFVMVTYLHHKNGEHLCVELPISFDSSNMQSLGSATTYARRYSLQMLLFINAEDDDDGNAAVTSTTSVANRVTQQQPTAQGVNRAFAARPQVGQEK